MEEVLKEKMTKKEVYQDLLDYFNCLMDDDKKTILHTLMNSTFKELCMNPNQMEDYMVHNIRTGERRYTLEEFSQTLFEYFLAGVETIIYGCVQRN